MKIAHIVNPVKVTEQSDLFIAQPITFETMRRARQVAELSGVKVELHYTCFEEDLSAAPDGFMRDSLLDRSILDINDFKVKRKLPLIKDILERLYQASNADYFIYTNVDIALQKDFYIEVKNIVDKGYDAFVINRRTIDGCYTSVKQLDEMYSDKGERHPGYDCFVFKREVYPQYDLKSACIGANWIGRVLISNVIAHAQHFKVFEDRILTFHIGDDRSWKVNKYNDYDKFNEECLIEILHDKLQNEATHNRSLLETYYNQHAKSVAISDIISAHTVQLELPINENALYGSKFKWSNSWNERTFLRQDPVFIVGYPRSGTTLLQALLATQSEIISLPETHFFNWVRSQLIVDNDIILPECTNVLIDAIRERIRFSINAENHIRELIDKRELSPKMLFEIIVVDNIIDKVNDYKILENIRWIEKTPDHALSLNIISQFYPKAKFIYIIRNPEKAIISRRTHFSSEKDWPIEKHANAWLNSVDQAEKFQQKYPEKLIMIKFEEVVSNIDKEITKIGQFINLKIEATQLKNHKDKSNDFILPWESWKKDVSNQEISSQIAQRKEKKLNGNDLSKLMMLLGDKIVKYHYKGCFPKYSEFFELSQKFDYSELLCSLDDLVSISVFKNPIQKVRAYLDFLKVYQKFT